MPLVDLLTRYAHQLQTVNTAIAAALRRGAGREPELQLDVRVEACTLAPVGEVPAAAVLMRRHITAEDTWYLVIGYQPPMGGQSPSEEKALEHSLDFTIFNADPPLVVPGSLDWVGKDRFGRDVELDVEIGPLVLTPTGVRWGDRTFTRFDDTAADYVARSLLKRVRHANPDDAQAALPGKRWQRVPSGTRKSGGQATVWKVRDSGDPESLDYYALKELRYAKGRDNKPYQRFVTEMHALQRLDHPNIVKPTETYAPAPDDEDEPPYYVMPWYAATLRNAPGVKGNVQRVSAGAKLW